MPTLLQPLPAAALCALCGVLLLLPRPDIAAACVLLLAASYLLLQHYEEPAAAPPPSASVLPSADAVAALVAKKLAAAHSEPSGQDVLAALDKARKAEQEARAWKKKCEAACEEKESLSATARELSQALNALGQHQHQQAERESRAESENCLNGDY